MLADRFHLCVENMMRPLALPFAGGLVSAVLLFGMLVPSFAAKRDLSNDVRVDRFTEPAVKQWDPFSLPDTDCAVEVVVDEQGRMIDYTIDAKSSVANNAEFRRLIENKLLFISFTPATTYGQPTTGRVFIYFSGLHVKS